MTRNRKNAPARGIPAAALLAGGLNRAMFAPRPEDVKRDPMEEAIRELDQMREDGRVIAPPEKQRRMVAWIPDDAFVEGRGWRVSIVIEGEAGHHPTGDWPYEPRGRLPWFWGREREDLAAARERAYEHNARGGISRADTDAIVLSSIGAQLREERGAGAGGGDE